MTTPHQQKMIDRIEKLTLGPHDILIVHDRADMDTLIDMTQQGIGFSHYGNPILFIAGGLQKASIQDLKEALRIAEIQTAAVNAIIDMVN